MKPDSVETILKKARHAQFAILVCAIVWPFLSLWTIELIARRKEIAGNAFWIRFFCTAGIWILLYFWATRTSRAVVGKKNQVSQAHDRLNRWLLVGVVVLVLLNSAFMLTDDSFGAWPNVTATVVLHMLALPALALGLLSLGFIRFVTFTEKTRAIPIPSRIRTTSSQIVGLCSALFLMTASAFGGSMATEIILKNGRVLSPWILGPINHSKMVYRNISPEAYWTYTELYILMAMIVFVLSIAPACEVIAQEKLRRSTPFQKILLWGSGLLFSILVAVVIWSCKNS
ncbi:MAG TPA: hypothetical protein VJT54_18225 [Verrucomicrobiae bacterium]|nr:hypothetical protein [Verrucomicrobiae bacterium]